MSLKLLLLANIVINYLCKVVHVDGEVNPVRDMATIQEELRLKDVEHLTKRLAEVEKVYTRGNNKQVCAHYLFIS